MRLNGWQRLWIMLSLIYLVPVVGLAIVLWPKPEATRHRDEFIARLPAELRNQIEDAYASTYEWEQALRASGGSTSQPIERPPKPGGKSREVLPPGFVLSSAPVQFDNGAVLQVRVAERGDSEPDARVAVAYGSTVEAATRAARREQVLVAVLVWLVPSFAGYGLGWAVAWVRRGFSRDVTT
jgi:hypothetical protein